MKFVTHATLAASAALLLGIPAMGQGPSPAIGTTGDIHVYGDFDGDGRLDYAVWRPSNGTFYVQLTTGVTINGTLTTFVEQQLGAPGDIPVVGNYSGNVNSTTSLPITDYAVWRPANGTWYYVPSTPAGAAIKSLQWGASGDIPVVGDFDGDGKDDFVVWRPSTGTWYLTLSGNPTSQQFQWGNPGDVPLTGDFDGSGKSEMAVWRPSNGTWYVISGKDGSTFSKQWGAPGDIPYAADFDADGITDYAVWRPSQGNLWVSSSTAFEYVARSRPPTELVNSNKWEVGPLGAPGSLGKGVFVLVNGDFDGDGIPDFGLFDAGLSSGTPNAGSWYVVESSKPTTPVSQAFGLASDVPVPGFYSDAAPPGGSSTTTTDFAVWRPSNGVWYVLPSDGSTPYNVPWGAPNDIPVVGDYDGDGKVDFVVWRPGNGTWYCILTSKGPASPVVTQWGAFGDVPLSGSFIANTSGGPESDLVVWRPSTGTWWIANGTKSITEQRAFGAPGDLPIGGDFDGDGTSDVAVWRSFDRSLYFTPSTNPTTTSIVSLGVAGNQFIYNEPPVTPFIGAK
ncbi:MAG: VCBS repeat-containing protein [Acidobacteriaceae bacterium]|nr:VCBS repeat-containing protein [Acidobacteriaceae bacterium]